MTRVLFVCHGNICRSAMAEYVMKYLVKQAGANKDFYIASAATSTEELGNDVYPPVKQLLFEKGIPCKGHSARQIVKRDYTDYDMLIVMDHANYRNTLRAMGGDPEGKISYLTDYSDHSGEIDDPWYTRDFEGCYRSVLAGCKGLLNKLMK